MHAKYVTGPPINAASEINCMKAEDFEGCMKYKSKQNKPMSIEWPKVIRSIIDYKLVDGADKRDMSWHASHQ